MDLEKDRMYIYIYIYISLYEKEIFLNCGEEKKLKQTDGGGQK